MARYDDINARMVLYVTAFSCILLFVIIQAGQALTYYWSYAVEEKVLAASEYESSRHAIREQQASVSGYRWVTVPPAEEGGEPQKKLQIPLERAREVILQEARTQTSGT